MTSSPGSIVGVVESVLYVTDLAAARQFYGPILRLTEWGYQEGRHLFYHVGEGLLLLFDPKTTSTGPHDLPLHGTQGGGHLALGIASDDYDDWKQHLLTHQVAIEHEHHWPHGGRSFYFRDPSENSLELITPGVWGLPNGW